MWRLTMGKITGFEGAGYLINHYKRNLPEPSLSKDEAQEKLNPALKIESSRLTVIPLETREEKLCYEFKTSYKGDDFLIYINALDGREEQILKLLKTPGGTWTM